VNENGGALPGEIEEAQRFAWTLEGLYDADLVSVVLYGSAARGEYRAGISDLNLLVILRDALPLTVRRGTDAAREWVALGNPPPLILSLEEWRGSADVFAIEMTEIREAHVLLAGADPFAGIEVDPADLRLQCERELKAAKLQLRERYLLFAGSPEELGDLLVRSFSTFLVLFRTILRLAGDDAAGDPGTLVRRLALRAGFDPAPLLEVHQARELGRPPRPSAADPLVTGYLAAVNTTADYVDRLLAEA
jgi:hypothetical protein